MPELSHIDPRSAALLVMDYQVDTLTRFMTAAQSADAIACVPRLIARARDAGMMVIHVVVAFRPGHPEVSPRNPLFSALKANGMAVAGSEGAAIHPAAAVREGEPIVVKHRISPFIGTDLETLLRANGIDTLVLAGVHTSGVVLSTVRHAGDLDYRLVVVRDCCAQMQSCIRCCSTSSSRSRRPSSPRRSSPAPCLAGLRERTRAIDLERGATPPIPLLGALILALCVRSIRRECRSLAGAGFESRAYRRTSGPAASFQAAMPP
jgi:nicotinamidase-related amidase